MTDALVALSRNVQSLLLFIVCGLLGWVALTVMDLQNTQIELRVRMASVERQTEEIVPRSENERRYDALERQGIQNFERIGSLEQRCGFSSLEK